MKPEVRLLPTTHRLIQSVAVVTETFLHIVCFRVRRSSDSWSFKQYQFEPESDPAGLLKKYRLCCRSSNLLFFGNCKYYQNVATLTCGSGSVAGSGMVGTDPFTRVSVEAKPALY